MEWDKRDTQSLGAALSYYTVLPLHLLLVIAVSIAGLVFGAEAVRGASVAQMRALVGSGADAIQAMLVHT